MPTVREAITDVASADRASSVMTRLFDAGFAEDELRSVSGVFMAIDIANWPPGPDKAAVQRVRELAGGLLRHCQRGGVRG